MFRQPKPLAADMLGMEKIIPMGNLRQTGKTRMMSEFVGQYLESGSGPLIVKKMLPDTHVAVHNGKMSMFEFVEAGEEHLTQVMQAICRINKNIPSPSYPYFVRVVPPPTWIFGRKPGEVALARAFGLDNNDNYAAASAEFAKGVIMAKASNAGKSLTTSQIIEQIGAVNARLGGPAQPTDYQRVMLEAFFNGPKKTLH